MANFNTNSDGTGTAQVMSSTIQAIVGLTAATATLTQGCLIDVSFGQGGTIGPSTTDGNVTWEIARITTVGTSTAFTPLPTQPAWRAAGTVAGVNHTVAPTGITTAASILYAIPINQRASYRWMPVPGSELYWPATNLSGLAVSAKSTVSSSYVGTVIASVTHTE